MSSSVPSLLIQATWKFVKCLSDGTVPSDDWHLNTAISNKVHQEFCRLGKEIESEELLETFCSKMHMSKIDLRNCVMTDYNKELIHSQNLVTLTLANVKYDKKGTMNAEKFLKSILNKTTQIHLQHLEFSGFEKKFARGWAETLSRMVPNLKRLIVFGQKLTSSEFLTIGENLPNLTVLDISNTQLKSLAGIGKLKNLEVLAIGGLLFENSSKMLDLFCLINLRVLDFSTRQHYAGNLLKQFLSCERVLPNLRMIDCSTTNATNEMIIKLIRTHPTIKMISLIDTESTLTEYRGVQLLTTSSLKASFQSLRHYKALKNEHMIGVVILETYKSLKDNFDSESNQTLNKWHMALCSIMVDFPLSEVIHREATHCLKLFFKNNRISILSISDRHYLVKLLLETLQKWDEWYIQKYENIQYCIAENIWKMLKDYWLLESEDMDLGAIFDAAFYNSMAKEGTVVEAYCLQTMKKVLHLMDYDERQEIYEDDGIWIRMIRLADWCYEKNEKEIYKLVFKLLKDLSENSMATFVEVKGVDMLVRHLKKWSFPEALEVLSQVALCPMYRKELKKPDNFKILAKFLVKMARNLKDPSKIDLFAQKTFRIGSILSILLTYSTKESQSPVWKQVNQVLEHIFKNLSHESLILTFPFKIGHLMFPVEFPERNGPVYWGLWTLIQKTMQSEYRPTVGSQPYIHIKELMNRRLPAEMKKMAKILLDISVHL